MLTLVLSVLSFSNALAFVDTLGVCPTPEALADVIYICRDNAFVSKKAQECGKQILGDWRVAGRKLAQELKLQNAIKSQKGTQENTDADYARTILALNEQIDSLERNTDRIASYNKAMINFPNAVDDATSLSCFVSAFHELQAIVTYLDKETIHAKKIRNETLALRGVVQSKISDLAEISNANPLATGLNSPSVKHLKGLSNNRSEVSNASDVEEKGKVLAGLASERFDSRVTESNDKNAFIGTEESIRLSMVKTKQVNEEVEKKNRAYIVDKNIDAISASENTERAMIGIDIEKLDLTRKISKSVSSIAQAALLAVTKVEPSENQNSNSIEAAKVEESSSNLSIFEVVSRKYKTLPLP